MALSLLPCSDVRVIRAYLRALGRRFTYDVRRNPYLWFGFLWGLPVPISSMALDIALLGMGDRSLLGIVSGHPLHLFFLAHPFLFGIVFGAIGTVRRDLQQENDRLIETLRTCAMTDPLTGLYNRRHALEELTNMLHRARRSGKPVSVVLFDVDDFKPVNETRGHLEGDRALQRIARSLKSVVREGDLFGRYGGDEFLFVAEDNADGARALVERTVETVRVDTGFTLSAGIAMWPADGCTPEALIGTADARMAAVKRETKRRMRNVRQVEVEYENHGRRR